MNKQPHQSIALTYSIYRHLGLYLLHIEPAIVDWLNHTLPWTSKAIVSPCSQSWLHNEQGLPRQYPEYCRGCGRLHWYSPTGTAHKKPNRQGRESQHIPVVAVDDIFSLREQSIVVFVTREYIAAACCLASFPGHSSPGNEAGQEFTRCCMSADLAGEDSPV